MRWRVRKGTNGGVRSAGGVISIAGLRIREPEPVVAGRPVTKAGRISLKGSWEGVPVKIFECANERHAAFVAELTGRPEIQKFFPSVHGVDGRLVVAEWVDGHRMVPRKVLQRNLYTDQLREVLCRLHGYDLTGACGFDYVKSYIKPRFESCCTTLGLGRFERYIVDAATPLLESTREHRVSHPDLRPANMVVTKSRQLKVIDNELLGGTQIVELDQINLIHGLGGRVKYGDVPWLSEVLRPLMTTKESEEALLALWIMRVVGARFADGRIRSILRIASMDLEDLARTLDVWIRLRKLVEK